MENVEIIRSNRRTLAIEIKNDCCIVVRAPHSMHDQDIQRFIREKANWIEKHLEIVKRREPTIRDKFADMAIRELTDAAKKDIPVRVQYYAPLVGVTVGKVTIRSQKTCWGSCSAKGNLNFNCLLMLCPEDVRDYVVVHELCHRKEWNHSVSFWEQVEKILPNYCVQRKWLKEQGSTIIGRLG